MFDVSFFSGPILLLFDLLLKGAVLLAFVHLLMWALRKKGISATVRRSLWSLAFAGLVFLPAGILFLPHISIPSAAERASTVGQDRTVVQQTQDTFPLETSAPQVQEQNQEAHFQGRQAHLKGSGSSASMTGGALQSQFPLTSSAQEKGGREVSGWLWAWMGIGGWGVGVIFFLARTVVGRFRLRRLREEAQGLEGGKWEKMVVQLKREFGIERDVQVGVHEDAKAPMAFGIFRPLLLLPPTADDWSEKRCRLVLRHELAHLRRRDLSVGLMVQIAHALHWPNPLAWTGRRIWRRVREAACDETVLASGTGRTDYARQLVDVAREALSGRRLPSAALTMARPGQLKRRVQAILDGTPDVEAWSTTRKASTGAIVISVLLLVAILRPLPDSLYPAYGVEADLRGSGLLDVDLPERTAIVAGFGFDTGGWELGSNPSIQESPHGWQSTERRWWEAGLDTSRVFRNLESLMEMGVVDEEIPMGLSQNRFNFAIQRGLLELYRTNPETVDALFEEHAVPELHTVDLSEEIVGVRGNLRPRILNKYKKKAYRVITDFYREPSRVEAPSEIPYPDSLRTQGIEGRVELQAHVNRQGQVDAVEVQEGLHPTLDAIAMKVSTRTSWEPAYVLEAEEWSPVEAWVRFPIAFSTSR